MRGRRGVSGDVLNTSPITPINVPVIDRGVRIRRDVQRVGRAFIDGGVSADRWARRQQLPLFQVLDVKLRQTQRGRRGATAPRNPRGVTHIVNSIRTTGRTTKTQPF